MLHIINPLGLIAVLATGTIGQSELPINRKVSDNMASSKLSSGQCRAARALLGWTQKDLESRCRVNQKTIADFERGQRTPFPRTLRDLIEAFEVAGICFLEAEEGVGGQGVRLAWGVEPALRQGGDDDAEAGGRGRKATQALPDDPNLRELYDYWRGHPDEWMALSEPSRGAVLAEIFGDVPVGDPITDAQPLQ